MSGDFRTTIIVCLTAESFLLLVIVVAVFCSVRTGVTVIVHSMVLVNHGFVISNVWCCNVTKVLDCGEQ